MTGETERLNSFLREYEVYAREVLQPTHQEVRALLEGWRHPNHWSKYQRTNRIPIPSPVQRVTSRIKRPEQVVDKILRKPESFPDGLEPCSFRRMRDAVGVRILVYFLSHLPLIDRELRSSDTVEISEAEPPIAYMSADQSAVLSLDHLDQLEKESGYASVHYTVRLRTSEVSEVDRPWFELQVRTLAQELWSAMEHHLGYKPGKRTNMSIKKQFRILSKHISAIDEHFNFLYEELNRFQGEAAYDGEDPLNAENLPSVLAEIGVSCAQRDINNILKFLYSRGVDTVREMRDLARARRLDMIRNTFVASVGRQPVSLEVIATLAALRGASSSKEEVQRIRAQIAYRGAWDAIRQESNDAATDGG